MIVLSMIDAGACHRITPVEAHVHTITHGGTRT